MKHLLACWLLLILNTALFAQRTSVFGKWKTIDDDGTTVKSIVEIFEKEGKTCGKVTQLFRDPSEDQDPVCDKCKEDDPRYMQKVIGMEILKDMEQDGEKWEDGKIMDPDNGKSYDCKMWIEDGKLQVRGYIMFFFRTQTWLPAD